MLPDLPNVKIKMQELCIDFVQVRAREKLGVFSKCKRERVHEGNSMRVVRADGSVSESSYERASGELTISYEQIQSLTAEERLHHLDGLAGQLAHTMSVQMFSSINKVLDEAGQVVDGGGRPLDAEIILSIIGRLEIDFDREDGKFELSIVVSPDQREAFEKVFAEIFEDVDLKRRHDELIAQKRAEWRDREAARKLVG